MSSSSAPAPDASGKSVFFLGATGYIGATVFQSILASSTPPSRVTVLVRDPSKGSAIESLPWGSTSVHAVKGSLSDLQVLTEQAANADITVHCASADDEDAIKAILAGQQQRREKTGHRPLLIHTSGTGVLIDEAFGEYPSDKIYTDLAPTSATSTSPALLGVDSLPDNAPHRPVDLAIVQADAKGYTKAYIVIPSTIWGAGQGTLYDQGLANGFSDQVPTLCKIALGRGQAGFVGKGANIWNHVSIADLGDLYRRVYEGALKGDIGHGREGYYFGVAGEYTWRSNAEAIAAALEEQGWAKEGVKGPSPLTKEELGKLGAWARFSGGNSRARGVRASSIGWKPKNTDVAELHAHAKQELVRVEKAFGRDSAWK